MSPENSQYDLVLLGGGLASNLVARYLKKKIPSLRILILEKNIRTHWNPGESTVGVAGIFLIRDLGLSTYCYLNHLPKNGLRYFFQDPDQSFDPTDCSEIGSNILPIFPTFQVDRARLDADLWELNRELEIDVSTGSQVLDVELGTGEKDHRILFERDGKQSSITAKWLFNASGRNSKVAPVFQELAPLIKENDLLTAASWGRFKDVKDIDGLGSDSWRERVGYTSRYLSTNHFMGKGYWIWVIPIDKGVVSFGIVYDKEVFKQEVDTQESFLQFLHNDPFTKLLLEGSTILDFQSHPHLSFRREKFCSPDCWAIIGDSFGFIDPFYSPGSDTIARQAYLLEHLVTTKDEKELQDLCDLMNSYTAFEYQILKLLYTDQYAGFESFEVFNIKSLWDFHSYTNRMVWNFYARKFADLDWLRREVEASDRSLELTRSLQKGFRDLYRYFKDAGLEKRHNQGHYSLRQNRFQIEEEMLLSYSDERSVDEHLYLCRLSVSELIEHRFEIPDFIDHKISQDLLTFASLSSFRLDQDWLDSFFLRVSRRFSLALRQRIGEKMKIEITAKDYLGRLPRCLEKKTVQIQTAALQIWTQKAYNPVFDQLIGKKERTFDGPSWKENS